MNNVQGNTDLPISLVYNDDCQQAIDLILPIQQIEFNVNVTLEDQPDLQDIEKYYHREGGAFWGVKSADELIGTIALLNIGHHAGAIRKMFVKKEFRGHGKEQGQQAQTIQQPSKGIAQQLLDTLVQFCREHDITDLYLGTVEQLKAARRFYEKNGFTQIKKEHLPAYFPLMQSDNVFYHLHLA